MNLFRTNPAHPEYQRLIRRLDRDLAVTDGEDHAFYAQFNKSDAIRYAVLLLDGETALACGALKAYDNRSLEVKRMYTTDAARGRGLAGQVLQELETWASELGYRHLLLETGRRQAAAIRLYEKHGYRRMEENYGPYTGAENSVCFEKEVG